MLITIIVCCLTCLAMILSVLFKPKFKIFNIRLDSYWVITLIGAIIAVIVSKVDVKIIINSLIQDSAINPIKILVLFISMTILSIFLDELGFFGYLANVTLKKAKTSQIKLFLYLYVAVSVLTVFTSNDVIILSFTPFICYFAKNAKISPIPYLTLEFVAANTWSMALIIGNPTNIYLASAYNIDFFSYFKTMLFPTILAGITAFIVLYLIHRKNLKQEIKGEPGFMIIADKLSLVVGIIHLAVCTILLAISSYVGIEMWLVSLISVVSLFLWSLIISLIRLRKPYIIKNCLIRAPWQLIPFVLSMFIMIIVLQDLGVTEKIAKLLGSNNAIIKYGAFSFLSANVINNIPMSALYCSIISSLNISVVKNAVFATIIGSNLGAFLTPIGALAGIMWNNILHNHDVKFSYLDFIKVGILVSIPTLLVSLLSLMLFV